MSVMDRETEVLLRLAVAIALGDEARTAERSREAVAAGIGALWVDELLLQSAQVIGYPRTLVGAKVWRETTGIMAPATDPALAETMAEWHARGVAHCRLVYGDQADHLRANVRALHPALEAGMITGAYGRVLSRPGLDPIHRELCSVAQIATMGAATQLYSHLRGALHTGASDALVEAAIAVIRQGLTADQAAVLTQVWHTVREREHTA